MIVWKSYITIHFLPSIMNAEIFEGSSLFKIMFCNYLENYMACATLKLIEQFSSIF